METYARADELNELVALLNTLNGPMFTLLEFAVGIADQNGEDFGCVVWHEDEGYVFVPDRSVLE